MISALLSIYLLKEKFICLYDTASAAFICTGTALTVLQMHRGKEEAYDREKVHAILVSTVALVLVSLTVMLGIFAFTSYFTLQEKVAQFKLDLNKWARLPAPKNLS